MRRFGEPRLVVVARWIWLCGLIPLPRQELPAAVLLLPDLQRADPGAVGLAVQLAFRNVEVAGNRTAADDRNLQFREINRFDGRFAVHHAVDDLGLVLDPPIGMAVAQLIGKELLEFCLVLRQRRLSERLDGLSDPGLVASLGSGGGVGGQARLMPPQGSAAPARSDRYSQARPTSKRACEAQSSRLIGRETYKDTQALPEWEFFVNKFQMDALHHRKSQASRFMKKTRKIA